MSIPTLTPQTGPQMASIALTKAQVQAALNTTPAAPQTLVQLLAGFISLPAGVIISQVIFVGVHLNPNGSAVVNVQYNPTPAA
jgi:hypothetical protein